MTSFIPGQRVISDTEPELGLGTISSLEHRSVQVAFPAADENRVYALEQAPLHRVRFSAGDSIKDRQDRLFHITDVREQEGLLLYQGRYDGTDELSSLNETELNDLTQLNKPQDRLLSGQFDNENWFRLRYDTLKQQHKIYPSAVRGLCGARVSLIPHQLYIAHEVAARTAPRVLLADEVGLGKTIEAGLILHQQLLTERAQRAIIVVPEPLLHQWLVEMLRRFNLRFNLFDEGRCEALSEDGSNPFLTEQLVLCSLSFFIDNPHRQSQAIDAGWDLLIVDEAHHLHWHAQNPSEEYRFIEALSHTTAGLLLLTATPEQLGASSHFARLRLIDPHRFHNLDAFLQEEQQYQPIAQAASELLDHHSLSGETIATLQQALTADKTLPGKLAIINDASADTDQQDETREQLLHQLIDRHGTGRVLFRNTRNAVKGFPLREVHAYALEHSGDYQCIHEHLKNDDARQAFAENFAMPFAQLMLSPEVIYSTLKVLGARGMKQRADWWQIDPRVEWLAEKLKALRNEKVLVICAHADTALELENLLRQQHALRVAVFHEGLRIVERDRAAAYFADLEEGAQALICSEIGSEGRNFQFAHHLILFDLPLNPDLLEQRIGRLDRIGQRNTIQIHVPYLNQSPQQAMYHWYHHGMQAFTHTCPAGAGVYEKLEPRLLEVLHAAHIAEDDIETLVNETKPVFTTINQRLQSGRDRLLELNSFRSSEAKKIRAEIHAQDNDSLLVDYLSRVCDAYGVEFEDHSASSYIMQPSDHMQVHHFPELKEDAITICFDRDIALAHEDRSFMSWENPMINGIFDMLMSSERGNACLSVCKIPGHATGSLLLESLFSVECVAERQLQVNDFLPPTVIRILLTGKGENIAAQHSMAQLSALPVDLGKQTIDQIIHGQQSGLRAMLSTSEQHATTQATPVIQQATRRMQEKLNAEISRLEALARINPNIRQDEIEFLSTRRDNLGERLQTSRMRLDAVRLIIAA